MKCKICPSCGQQNDPTDMECAECGYDLTSTPVVDSEEAAKAADETQAAPDAPSDEVAASVASAVSAAAAGDVQLPTSELVRVCSCGELNPPQLRKCRRCHEDISDILPTPRPHQGSGPVTVMSVSDDADPAAADETRSFVFEERNTGALYPIPSGTTTIGRESGMSEVLGGHAFVSRVHAQLTAEGGRLYIENFSHTNGTYVNNKKIPQGRVELHAGDEVGLGGWVDARGQRQAGAAYFSVGDGT